MFHVKHFHNGLTQTTSLSIFDFQFDISPKQQRTSETEVLCVAFSDVENVSRETFLFFDSKPDHKNGDICRADA